MNEEASCSLSEGHEESSLYEKMRQIKLQKIREQQEQQETDIIRVMLRNFLKRLLDPKQNLLEYWEIMQCREPQLHKLATIVLVTPATQVSVERLFSGLRYIMSSLRGNLKEDITDSILLICSNKDLLDGEEDTKKMRV